LLARRIMLPVSDPGGHMDERLTISEASKRYSVSPSAIRRLIDSKRLNSAKDVDGKHRVLTGELVEALARRASGSRTGAVSLKDTANLAGKQSGQIAGDYYNTSERYMRLLETALEHEKRISEELRQQNRELQGQIVKIASEMQAVLSRDTEGKLSKWFRR
jgi:excisionase family DNA binding protein